MGRKPKTTGPRARDPGAFKSVLVRINIEGWRALKVLAVENETTLNALAVEAFNDLLKKHGKRQLVENPLLDEGDRPARLEPSLKPRQRTQWVNLGSGSV